MQEDIYIPEGIVIEILSRLPVKSVAKCRCVCKSWYEITQERSFLTLHMNRSGERVEVFDDSEEDDDYEMKQTKDGLLLEENLETGIWRIRNPTTGYTFVLPDQSSPCFLMALNYLPRTDCYELVSEYREGENRGIRLLRVKTGAAWRDQPDPSFRPPPNSVKPNFYHAIGIHGVYFRAITTWAGSISPDILCLETENKRCVIAKTPSILLSDSKFVLPFPWGDDKFALAHLVLPKLRLEIWVLEDYGKNNWSEKSFLLPSSLFGRHHHSLKSLKLQYMPEKRVLWFTFPDGSLQAYQVDRKTVTGFYKEGQKRPLYTYVPTLINPEGNPPLF